MIVLRLLLASLVAFLVAGAATAASPTLDRIKASGTITFGYRDGAAPFSAKQRNGQVRGYSVELCEKVAAAVGRTLGLANLKVVWKPVDSETRITDVVANKVDAECGTTTITLSRMEKVDFSVPIFVDGGSALVRTGSDAPKSVSALAERIRTLANERLDELLPRGSFDLTQEYGGIVAASVVCELLGLPVDLAPDVLATVNAGSLAQPGSGVEVANARPGYLEYLIPIVAGRRSDPSDGSIADNLIGYRLPDGSAFNDIEAATQMLGVFIGGTETVPKIVAHGLWELGRRPDQHAAVRTDLDANVPVAREEMIRYCAPAQWFARTVRKPFTINGTTIEPGRRIITLVASASRDEREYANPDDFIWNRKIERLLAFGRGQHFCLGVHLARMEITIMVTEWLKRVDDWQIDSAAASRPPSSFQWGWNNIPVEV